jgi:glycosyltransferase involved in cell wall biosynthesis
MQKPWICFQLGAREHYAIPRSLHQSQQLHSLYTDTWVTPRSPLRKVPLRLLKPLHDRYHPDLSDATVHHATSQSILFELQQKAKKFQNWDLILRRNQWFQKQALCYLKGLKFEKLNTPPVLFSYSYAALDLLRYAKSQGWQTILGQIDPGILESQIVQEERDRHPELAPNYQSPPKIYWEQWYEECQLVDYILVNSSWSSQLLQQAGIQATKIHTVPLVYTPPPDAQTFTREYPEKFSDDRPLRVLFLGQVILRKGVAAVIEAAKLLSDRPVEFWIVGSLGIHPPDLANIRWFGSVPRSQVADYYQTADIFLFPTLSDGFGLTQLEAQAWKLPIITSQNCGQVIEHGTNGLILSEISGATIYEAICSILTLPSLLKRFSSCHSDIFHTCSLNNFGKILSRFSNF